MSFARHSALFLTYGSAAAVAFLLAAHLPAAFVGSPAVLAALGVLLAGFALHESIARRAADSALDGELATLRMGWADANRDLLRLRDEADMIRSRLARNESAPEVGSVVTEVKLLQSLIERLYETRTGLAAPAPEPQPEPVSTPPIAPPPAPHPSPVADVDPATPGATREIERPGPLVRRDLSDTQILDVLQAGLRDDRVELWLQPVVSLPQRKRRFYECYTRFPVGENAMVLPEQYIALAERTGLITPIDNILLFRCVQLVRKLRRRHLSVGFFCNISPRTLADRDFFRDFVAMLAENADNAASIMLEFPQSAIDAMDGELERDLQRLAGLGFRFSMDRITHLDFDPYALGQRNFRYLKIDAHRLLSPTEAGRGAGLAPLKRRFDRAGLDLIVEKIESEPMLLELLDLGIDFGQGYLFGEPRLSRPEL